MNIAVRIQNRSLKFEVSGAKTNPIKFYILWKSKLPSRKKEESIRSRGKLNHRAAKFGIPIENARARKS
ncbi:hypothetical protein BPAE_0002g01900 [Botrytis paeoniae]|uniref:Uncharacterized protein n=1 Tax=Botrytis paeoniae TaxID=278948 RepID=A0A4Z1G212_9HELO|nr:hypothetical protein BPAE_0002g01900 [Botrytis paeoniae]